MPDDAPLTPHEPRRVCPRCARPSVVCYCAHLTELPTRTKVLVLQHPRERDKPIGTARMAALCLPNAEIAVGVRFEDDARVRALLADPTRPALLLYPDAEVSDRPPPAPPTEPVTLVVLDGTWAHAKKLLNQNPFLKTLPRYAFTPPRPSEYRIRREPQADYVSTIEALCYTLGALEGDSARFEALLAPFRAMVEAQLDFTRRIGSARHRNTPRKPGCARSRLPAALLEPGLLCISVEANAWPYDPELGRAPHPHELVQLCALRLSDGARFEELVAPRLPLGPSAHRHSLLSEPALRAGISADELRRRWRAFLRDDDVLCSWGLYGVSLMLREQLPLPSRRIDLRKVSGDHLKARPGSGEDLCARLSLGWYSLGAGRGGERLAIAVAITRMLAQSALPLPSAAAD
jgi:DTW domain-containing protein YfiP